MLPTWVLLNYRWEKYQNRRKILIKMPRKLGWHSHKLLFHSIRFYMNNRSSGFGLLCLPNHHPLRQLKLDFSYQIKLRVTCSPKLRLKIKFKRCATCSLGLLAINLNPPISYIFFVICRPFKLGHHIFIKRKYYCHTTIEFCWTEFFILSLTSW